MKLRLQTDSLRLRLSCEDVGKLVSEEQLEECVVLGPTPTECFSYRLKLSSAEPKRRVQVDAQGLEVVVPKERFLRWNESKKMEWEEPCSESGARVLIEKDIRDFAS